MKPLPVLFSQFTVLVGDLGQIVLAENADRGYFPLLDISEYRTNLGHRSWGLYMATVRLTGLEGSATQSVRPASQFAQSSMQPSPLEIPLVAECAFQ